MKSLKRNMNDIVTDSVLLLYLIQTTTSKEGVCDKSLFEAKVRLMKLTFLAEYFMITKQKKGFNFFYNIYNYGPSSLDLLDLLDDLQDAGLIIQQKEKDGVRFSLSQIAKSTLTEYLEEEGEMNNIYFKLIDGIVDKYGALSYKELLDKVYSMNVQPYRSRRGELNIRKEVEKHSASSAHKPRLLTKMITGDYDKEFNLSEGWKETFIVLSSPSLNKMITG